MSHTSCPGLPCLHAVKGVGYIIAMQKKRGSEGEYRQNNDEIRKTKDFEYGTGKSTACNNTKIRKRASLGEDIVE